MSILQPIATAPTDGTAIIIVIMRDGEPFYMRKARWYPEHGDRWGYFTPDGLSHDYGLFRHPTHWIPLSEIEGE